MRVKSMMVFVTDFAEAKRFYGEVLGFPLAAESADRLEFAGDGPPLVAFRAAKPAPITDYANEAGSVFVFETEDVAERQAELAARGVRFVHAKPAQGADGRYAAFYDPFGNVHEIADRQTGVM